MTERPEGTPEASPDEPEAPPPEAETGSPAPDGPAAVAEELGAQASALESESDDAAVDEIEAELEADEATEDELAEEEAEEADVAEGTDDSEADAEGADAEDAEPEPGSATTGVAAGSAGSAVSRRRAAPPASVQRAPTQSELAVHVTDTTSRIFVIATVVVFVAILAFGLLAGNGGLFTATPAPPTAAPSVSAAPSASPS